MKNFKSYDITCALTHDLQVCEHCKKCGKFPDARMEMADYVERLEKAFDKACETLSKSKVNDLCLLDMYVNSLDIQDKNVWKEYLLKESEKE